MTDKLRTATVPFAMTPLWVLYHSDLNSHAVHLYGVLAAHADKEGRAFPSRRRLAALVGVSVNTADRAISDLLRAGAMLRERRADENGQTTNLYTVGVPPPVGASLRSASPQPGAPPSPQPGAPLNQTHSEPELGDTSEQVSPARIPNSGSCSRPGCDRGAGHPGPHRDPWYEKVAEALTLQVIPEHQRSMAGSVARRAEKNGHPPERILEAARWIALTWGPEKLTMASLYQHYERATSPLAQITERQIADLKEERDRQETIARIEAAASRSLVRSTGRKGAP